MLCVPLLLVVSENLVSEILSQGVCNLYCYRRRRLVCPHFSRSCSNYVRTWYCCYTPVQGLTTETLLCVCFTLNRSFYPSTPINSVGADFSSQRDASSVVAERRTSTEYQGIINHYDMCVPAWTETWEKMCIDICMPTVHTFPVSYTHLTLPTKA